MTKSRMGKTDIFARTAPTPDGEAAVALARSSVENKLTIILPPDLVDFLDRLALDIRAKTKAKIRRTEIIRALVAGVRASGLNLTGYGTESDIAAAIQGRLKG